MDKGVWTIVVVVEVISKRLLKIEVVEHRHLLSGYAKWGVGLTRGVRRLFFICFIYVLALAAQHRGQEGVVLVVVGTWVLGS